MTSPMDNNNTKHTPTLVISLDFELLWGIFDRPGAGYKEAYFKNTRDTVPRMLALFAKYNVEVTWATVGMLMAENREEWESYLPEHLPTYADPRLSPYEWVKLHGMHPELHFAPELVRDILETPGQELGSHSFSHFYTQEPGQTLEQFRADLQAAQKIANEKFNTQLSSLVFPRNQYSKPYLKICFEEGFRVVRTNPGDWFWKNPELVGLGRRLFRAADTLFPLGKETSYLRSDLETEKGWPLEIPASRLLRPALPQYPFINRLKNRRVHTEMTHAAQNRRVYHLWWHPHNFGNHPHENLKDLEGILQVYKILHEEYGMVSLTMGNLAKEVLAGQVSK